MEFHLSKRIQYPSLRGKLHASCAVVTTRDAPLMMIGEGANEIHSLVIARNLLERYKIN